MFSPIFILIAIVVAGWAVWFMFGIIRYIVNGDNEIDKRLHDISQSNR